MRQGRQIAWSFVFWIALIVAAAAVLYWVAGQRDEVPPPGAPTSGLKPSDHAAIAALQERIAVLVRRLDALETRSAAQSERLRDIGLRIASLGDGAPPDAAAESLPPVVVFLHRDLAGIGGVLKERLTGAGFRVRLEPDPNALRPFDLDGYPAVAAYGALSPFGSEGNSVRYTGQAAPQALRVARLAAAAGLADVRLSRRESATQGAIELVLAPANAVRK